MNPESWGFIGTLVGAIVGASVSIFATRINSANAIRIQENIENNARKERYRVFQRNTLLELQEKLSYGMRLVNKAYFERFVNYKKTNNWRTALISDELDGDITNCFRELSIKTERVDNNELRNEIISIRGIMASFVLAETHEIAENKQFELTDAFEILMPKLGKVLRENY